MASELVLPASYVTVTVWLLRSTWTFSTPSTRLALSLTRGMQLTQVTVGTVNFTVLDLPLPSSESALLSFADVRFSGPLPSTSVTVALVSRPGVLDEPP